MNADQLLLWGFAATVILTAVMAISKPLGLTRMDLPFLLGTMVTANRNKAPVVGFLLHVVMGWLLAFIYAAAFRSANLSAWWFGAAIGLVHGTFVLSVGLQILASFHPRMAQPFQGPTPTKQLEPPGYFALNYGKGTPLTTLLAHVLYGSVLGMFYQ